MKRLLYLLFALLGFGIDGCARVEYGTPHVTFRLTARVVDEAGTPIQGIHVRTSDGEQFEYNTGVSDYLGNIEAMGTIWPGAQYEVTFVDIDGPLNGGEFEPLTVETHAYNIAPGEGGWYEGGYAADMGDVVLKKKVTEDEE